VWRLSRSTWQGVILAVGTGALLWLLYAVREVLLPFGAALFLVYLTEPLLVRLEQRQVPRVVAILVVYAAFFGLVWLVAVYLWPLLVVEAERAFELLAARLDEVRALAAQLAALGRDHRLPAMAAAVLTGLTEEVERMVADAGRRAVATTLSVFSRLALLLLAPVIAFYLSRDLPAFRRDLPRLFPPSGRGEARQLLREVNAVLGGYVRGQLVISSFVGFTVWIGLALLGLPYAALIGLLAGLFDVIPYFGPVIGAIPAVALALGQSAWTAASVILLFVAVHQFEGLVLVPRIMGRRVGLHPVVVIFVLLAGGHLFGLGGMLLGVPVAAVARVILRFFLHRWLGREGNKPPEPLPEGGAR
jgi:predicted PurR-regulated permease PerM